MGGCNPPLHMPCFALEGAQGAVEQGEGSGAAEGHLSRSGVGHGDPEPRKLTCAAWPECPQLKHRVLIALHPGNLGFSFGRGLTAPCSMGFLCFL